MTEPEPGVSPTAVRESSVWRWMLPAVALGLSVIGLVAGWRDFMRPYTDTFQESLASMHAHGFALANRLPGGPNPFMARDLNCVTGAPGEYNHWPNGFFALLNGALWMFGNTETVGRALALVLGLAGLGLLSAAFARRYPLAIFLLPLILVSVIGRSAITFVFIDAVTLPIIGLAWFLVIRRGDSKLMRWSFRVLLVVAPFFLHLTSIFTLFAILWGLYESRSVKRAFADLLAWAIGLGGALAALCFTAGGFSSGFQTLLTHYMHRASVDPTGAEHVSWSALSEELLKTMLGNVFAFMPLSWGFMWVGLVVVGTLIWLFRGNRSAFVLVIALLASVGCYAAALRNYVGVHYFAQLPLVVLVSAAALIALSQWVAPASGATTPWPGRMTNARVIPALIFIVACWGVSMSRPIAYPPEPVIVSLDETVRQAVASTQVTNFTGVELRSDDSDLKYNIFQRACQFYFGDQIVDAALRGDPENVVVVDPASRTLTGP